jgi:drug/metabolite transporter (DMT)-like permease
MAHFVGGLMSLPFVLVYGDFYHAVSSPQLYNYVGQGVFFHSSYIGLLAVAYSFGDVGLVYPLARGTAITLATMAVELIGIGKRLTALENIGVAVVICGIMTLAYDAYRNILSTKDYSKLSSDSEHESDVEPEQPDRGDVELGETCRSPIFDEDDDLRRDEEDETPREPEEEIEEEVVKPSSPVAKARKARSSSLDMPIAKRPLALLPLPATDSEEVKDLTRKVSYSIVFAVLVGCCTASYSINDSYAVNAVPAITYSFLANTSVGLVYLPYLVMYKFDELKEAVLVKWPYLLLMAPATTGAYLIILFVFEIPGINLALVVALREFSVLVGTLLAIFVLKERASAIKITAVAVICAGMLLLKLG